MIPESLMERLLLSFMPETLRLLLPVIFPSWQFFREIAPSPRIEFSLLKDPEARPNWEEFRPTPKKLSLLETLLRIFHNPDWNETLYIRNCAEQLIVSSSLSPSGYSYEEILNRIRKDLARNDLGSSTYLQFRLVFVSREGSEFRNDVLFTSEVHSALEGELS